MNHNDLVDLIVPLLDNVTNNRDLLFIYEYLRNAEAG